MLIVISRLKITLFLFYFMGFLEFILIRFHVIQLSFMCTEFSLRADDKSLIVARTLDFQVPFKYDIVADPVDNEYRAKEFPMFKQ